MWDVIPFTIVVQSSHHSSINPSGRCDHSTRHSLTSSLGLASESQTHQGRSSQRSSPRPPSLQ